MEPSDRLELYKGREQSLIKHEFLSQYLQAAAFKTLQGRSKTFNYVDAFAGPWNVRDGEFADSSFDLAINMLESVRVALARNGASGLKIRFCLCEKNASAFQRLRDYAAMKRGFEIHVFSGLFEENLQQISKAIPDGFTFTFIDPRGWNIRNHEVFTFLRERDGDFLLNFMADHINRHAEYSQVSQSFGRFLANPEWEQEYATLPNEWSCEQRILYLLKKNLKAQRVAKFIPDFSILVPTKNRVKMKLVLGTNNPAGLEVFRDVQSKVEFKQIEIRDALQQDKTRQASLLDIEFLAKELVEVGSKKSFSLGEDKVLEVLRETKRQDFASLATFVLEEVPLRKTQIKDLMNRLRGEGKLNFELAGKQRKVQDDTRVSID